MSDERDIIAEAISAHMSAAEHAHKTHFDAASDVLAALSAAGLRLTPVAQHASPLPEEIADTTKFLRDLSGSLAIFPASKERLLFAAAALERMAREIERLSNLERAAAHRRRWAERRAALGRGD